MFRTNAYWIVVGWEQIMFDVARWAAIGSIRIKNAVDVNEQQRPHRDRLPDPERTERQLWRHSSFEFTIQHGNPLRQPSDPLIAGPGAATQWQPFHRHLAMNRFAKAHLCKCPLNARFNCLRVPRRQIARWSATRTDTCGMFSSQQRRSLKW